MPKDPPQAGAPPALSPSAIAELYKGNKIEGIKIVREEQRVGLKEAKDAVEEYLASQPSLRSTLAAAQSRSQRTFLFWLVIFIALAALGYHWLKAP
jgi:hypothetical protein